MSTIVGGSDVPFLIIVVIATIVKQKEVKIQLLS